MRDISEVLDDIGVGRFHVMQSLILGSINMMDGAEVLLCTLVLGSLQQLWDLSPMYKAAMMSLVFVGLFMGSLTGGPLADKYGRRTVILASYVGFTVAGLLTATAWSPVSMMSMRFVCGIFFGMGIGPAVALQAETTPAAWRGFFLNLISSSWTVGEIYTSLLFAIFLPTLEDPEGLQWRYVTVWAVAPALMMAPFAFLVLRESPYFLLVNGRSAEAASVMKYMATANGIDDTILGPSSSGEPPEISAPEAAMGPSECTPLLQEENSWQQFRLALARDLCPVVFGGSYLCCLANFLFYGLSYGLPQVFSAISDDSGPAIQVLIASSFNLPGGLLTLLLLHSRVIGHRDGLALLLLLCTQLQLGLITLGMTARWNWVGWYSAYVSKPVVLSFMTLTYLFLGEVFPSAIRCTGLSICLASGRLGSILAPVIFELLTIPDSKIGTHGAFGVFNAVLCVVGVMVIKLCFSYELKNAPLEDSPRRLPKEGTERAG